MDEEFIVGGRYFLRGWKSQGVAKGVMKPL